MSSAYEVAPIFLIRIAGVPFDSVKALATPQSSRIAHQLNLERASRDQAKVAVEKAFRSGERLLAEKDYRNLRSAIRADRPPAPVEGEKPPFFSNYAAAATRVRECEEKLTEALEREVGHARRALLRASHTFLSDYLIFGAEAVRLFMEQLAAESADGALTPRNQSARKIEQTLLLYLQRVATKNDTFSAFGPSTWGMIQAGDIAVELHPQKGITAREVFLERWTAHAAAAAINADPEIGQERLEVRAMEPHAFEILIEDVKKWEPGPLRDRWLGALQPLDDLRLKFATAATPAERAGLLSEARTQLEAMGATHERSRRFLYAATNPIGEECVRESDFRLSPSLIDEVARDAEPWIDFWRDSYAFVASRVSAGLAQVLQKVSPAGKAIPLPTFLAACEAARLPLKGPGLVALAAIAFQEVKAAFRERLLPHVGKEVYDLTTEDCHVVRNNFKYPHFDEYTYPSADLQLAATSPEAVASGQYEWIVSELHPPVALLHHGVYWGCPDKGALNQAFARGVFNQPNFHFGFFVADFTAHTTVRIFDALPDLSYFVAPERGNSAWRTVAPADAEVYIDEKSGDVRIRQKSTQRFLGSFARAWVIPLGFHPFQFGIAPHTPRLRCGRVIVQRRTWTVRSDELPEGRYAGISPGLVAAIDGLRSKKGWPRYIYIRPTEQALRRSGAEGRDKDTKPVFIDLESYLFLEIFHRWLIKAGELEITEMLPAPDQLLWREPDGRRTFELRTLIIPRA